MSWIGLMMGKALNYRKPEVWLDKIKAICGERVKYEAVSGDVLTDNGDWYLFLKDSKWREHIIQLKRCRFVVSVVSVGDMPYLFSDEEIKTFVGGVKAKREAGDALSPGDIVIVKDGYLANLYGIVESVSGKTANVFFSFYVRCFIEKLKVSCLKKVSRTDFDPSRHGQQVTMGAQVVFTNNIYR